MRMRDRILRRRVQLLLQSEDNDETDVEKYIKNCRKTTAITSQVLWFVLGVICFSMCFYQVYDRVSYYLSIPLYSDVTINTDAEEMPLIELSGIDTQLLQPYWRMLKHPPDEPTKHKYRNYLPTLMFDIGNDSLNFNDFWAAIRIIPNVERVLLKNGNKILSDVHFESGNVVYSTNSSIINWVETNAFYGAKLTFKLREKVQIGTSLIIQLRITGYPWITVGTASSIQTDYMSTTIFKSILISYSIENFVYLNTRMSPCEPSLDAVKQCYLDCEKELLNKLTCRLPFMPNNSKTIDCTDLATTKEMYFAITSSNLNCSCQKPCKRILEHKQILLKSPLISGRYNVTLRNDQTTVVEKKQKIAYDTISLLVDIGGSLGLFLGLSLLSLCKLIHSAGIYFILIAETLVHKYAIRNSMVITEIRTLSQVRNIGKKIQYWCKCCKLIYVSLMVIVSSIAIISRIQYHSTEPTRVVVSITENNTIVMPSILACGQSEEIAELKHQIAKRLQINECELNLIDLIDGLKKNDDTADALLVQMLWQNQIVKFDYKQPPTALNGIYLKFDEILMPSGTCIETSILRDPGPRLSTFRTGTLFTFSPISLKKCMDKIIQIYLRTPGGDYHSLLVNRLDILPASQSVLQLDIRIIKRYNSTLRICATSENFETCKLNCYDTKLQTLIKCKLPFMHTVNKTICTTTATAAESLSTYLLTVLRTNLKDECNCFPPCTEIIYETFWELYKLYNAVMMNTLFTLDAMNNNFENIVEIPIYGVVSLLCDFGNILSITLGLSVLSFLCGGYASFNLVRKYQYKQYKGIVRKVFSTSD